MTSLCVTTRSTVLQEFKPAFAFSFFVHAFVQFVRIGSAPVGNSTAVHCKAKEPSVLVAIKTLKGLPVLRMPRRSVAEVSVPFVFQQGQVAVASNGDLIGTLQEYLPVHLGPKLTFCLFPLKDWSGFNLDLPAWSKLSLRRLFKDLVGPLVFGKFGSDLFMAFQRGPRPFGVSQIQNCGGADINHNDICGACAFQSNRALQIVNIGFGAGQTGKPQKGEGNE
ncbi:hypothetical protein SAMN04515695_0986 [Pseudovibrio sp. Tun.PSC04-5.I4]|nr:hypothetical protein SAMN04515695_0986 [Pseudovibrio sp. Tun.PSC04-5.I4]